MGNPSRAFKLARFWYTQRVTGFHVPDAPFFDPASTEWFTSRLASARGYLEFGSGGSTLLAARHGIPTVTVENDRWFAAAVRKKMPSAAANDMLVVDLGLTSQWGRPTFRRQTPARLARWRRYIEVPFDHIATERIAFPDLVLIDGRFRRACALKVAQQAALLGKTTTLCFDDYSHRPHYHGVEELLGAPRMNGRMAIFEIDGTAITIADSAIDEAARDFE